MSGKVLGLISKLEGRRWGREILAIRSSAPTSRPIALPRSASTMSVGASGYEGYAQRRYFR
jgi:hypothetical protein